METINLVLSVILILILAYKNFPFMWHIRCIRTLILRRYLFPVSNSELSPECLFLPAIYHNRSPLTECDYNIHKSNSTYLTDLDISRGNFSLLLFNEVISFLRGPDSVLLILSGVQCLFHREIKPYEPYEVWSRVLSWDDKWLYIVSHFVEKGAFRPEKALLQGFVSREPQTWSESDDEPPKRKVFASSVSRCVFKQGRITVKPESVFVKCGLLPSKDGMPGRDMLNWQAIENRRKRDLEIAQLRSGWDAVSDTFEGNTDTILGRYTDVL